MIVKKSWHCIWPRRLRSIHKNTQNWLCLGASKGAICAWRRVLDTMIHSQFHPASDHRHIYTRCSWRGLGALPKESSTLSEDRFILLLRYNIFPHQIKEDHCLWRIKNQTNSFHPLKMLSTLACQCLISPDQQRLTIHIQLQYLQ